MYSEYFNYNNCTTGITYYNYSNYCTTAYTNYSNVCTVYHVNSNNSCTTAHTDSINACSTSHDNSWSTSYGNANNYCSTSYTNTHANYCSTTYTNTHTDTCSTYHNDAANDCLTAQEYANHINYSNPNSGNPISLSWGSDWTGNTLNKDYVGEGLVGIKAIRDSILLLGTSKAQNNVTLTEGPVDSALNDSNDLTAEKVDDTNYNIMASNLNALILAINPSIGTLPLVSEGSLATKAQWETLKIKTDALASYQTTNYSNTVSYTVAQYTNHANTVNT